MVSFFLATHAPVPDTTEFLLALVPAGVSAAALNHTAPEAGAQAGP